MRSHLANSFGLQLVANLRCQRASLQYLRHLWEQDPIVDASTKSAERSWDLSVPDEKKKRSLASHCTAAWTHSATPSLRSSIDLHRYHLYQRLRRGAYRRVHWRFRLKVFGPVLHPVAIRLSRTDCGLEFACKD